MMKIDREHIAFGQLALSVSLLAFALLLYLVSFGGPSQHLAELCVLALSFGAFKIRPVEILETGENGGLGHAQVLKPQVPTVRVQLLSASLKPVTLPRPMPRDVWAPPAVASATGQPAELELAETIPAETTPSAAPQANIISEQALPIETVPLDPLSFEPRLWTQQVDDIARRHKNKFKFTLSPLVYGPEAEVMPIINACLPAGSLCDVTVTMRAATQVGRSALVGDMKQLGAVEAGKPFVLGQDAATLVMDENLRAKSLEMLALHKAAQSHDVAQLVSLVEPNAVQVPGNAASTAARMWVDLPKAERDRTSIFVSGRRLRNDVNREGQNLRHQCGELGEALYIKDTLVPVHLTRGEQKHPQSYRLGQVIELSRPLTSQGLPAGQMKVMATRPGGEIIVQLPGGKGAIFPPGTAWR